MKILNIVTEIQHMIQFEREAFKDSKNPEACKVCMANKYGVGYNKKTANLKINKCIKGSSVCGEHLIIR